MEIEISKQLVLLVGPPGSGKSTLAINYVHAGYQYINQDEQGKSQHLTNFLGDVFNSKNVIVDRMNFNKEQRERYLKPAREAGYKTKIIVIHESYDTCLERANKRTNHPTIKDEKTAKKALHTFFTKYERVDDSEADEVVRFWRDGLKPNAIICDLDGTLCDIDHRLHHLEKHVIVTKVDEQEKNVTVKYTKPNWKAFFEGIKDDKVNKWCESILIALEDTNKIVLCSGRPDDYKPTTLQWLYESDVHFDELFMRRRSDFRKDDIIKEIILDFEIRTRYTPIFAIDDRKTVVDMWRRNGLVCLQCAEGDF